MKDITTQPMSEKEIKNALSLFKKYIVMAGITYTHENPINQNCYISSSDIIGVYFPNTQFDQLKKHSHYDICSLSKVGGQLGIVYSLKDNAAIPERARIYFDNYIFEDFIDLLYGYHFKNIYKKLEKRIKDYTETLNTLSKIKRIYKKDGGNFADTLRNFDGVKLYYDYMILEPKVTAVVVGYNHIYLYREDEDKKAANTPTVEEVEKLIKKYMDQYSNYIKEDKNELQKLPAIFTKFKKIMGKLKEFRNSVQHWYDFKEEIDGMLI